MFFYDGQWFPSQEAAFQYKIMKESGQIVGTPEAGDYKPVAEPVASDYNIGPIDPSKLQGYDLLRRLATSQGPSEGARYSLQDALLQRQNQIDALSRQGAGAMAQARSSLASKGGVGAGARERLAGSGLEQFLLGKQGAYRGEAQARTGILSDDAKLKAGLLGDLNKLEYQYTEGNKQRELDRYKFDLEKWAADRQATAAERSARAGGGGK